MSLGFNLKKNHLGHEAQVVAAARENVVGDGVEEEGLVLGDEGAVGVVCGWGWWWWWCMDPFEARKRMARHINVYVHTFAYIHAIHAPRPEEEGEEPLAVGLGQLGVGPRKEGGDVAVDGGRGIFVWGFVLVMVE
jgi:hypothetical protein